MGQRVVEVGPLCRTALQERFAIYYGLYLPPRALTQPFGTPLAFRQLGGNLTEGAVGDQDSLIWQNSVPQMLPSSTALLKLYRRKTGWGRDEASVDSCANNTCVYSGGGGMRVSRMNLSSASTTGEPGQPKRAPVLACSAVDPSRTPLIRERLW